MSSRLLRALGLASALAWPLVAAAQTPTLKTINVDGNLSDWDEVLVNPRQTTLDGDGSSLPCQYSTDRDCTVQSTGRDLRRFAWTHDGTYVYFYVQRQGSASNNQTFWFYMDADLDQRMGFGDKVLRVVFNGSTGLTGNDLYRYVPDLAVGDPMTDPAGSSDGWDMPGDLQATSLWTEASPNGGSPDGVAFEERVPWSAIGVPAATPMFFHVASSNSPNPSNLSQQVDDNLGGPQGDIGKFGYEAVVIDPDNQSAIAAGASANYGHRITNVGTMPSRFAIQATSTLGLSLALHQDVNGDTLPDSLIGTDANGDGDYSDLGDSLDSAWDFNGDGLPDTPLLAAAQSSHFVVVVQTQAVHDGLRDVTSVRAFISGLPYVTDTATDVTDIGDVIIRSPDDDKNSVANQNVSFAVEVCNNGAPDTIDLTATSLPSWQVSLYSDPECDGVANDFLAQDTQGDGIWDVLVSGDSDGDTIPDTENLVTGTCACFVLVVRVPRTAIVGVVNTTTIHATGNAVPSSADHDFTTTVARRLDMFPDYLLSALTNKVSGANRPVYFAHVARNNWLIADRVDFSVVPPTNDHGWTVRTWSDPNGDGNIFDGAVITQTSLIPPNGGEVHFVVEVRIPAGVPNGTTSQTIVTGAAQLDPTATRDAVTDELAVSSIASYSDALLAIPTTFFAPCDTIYVQGTGLTREQGRFEDIYDLVWLDSAGQLVRFHDSFAPDVAGIADDRYVQDAADVPGTWHVELRERTLTIATLAITVEANAAITLGTGQPAYPVAGAALDIQSSTVNGNLLAPLDGGHVEYVVLDAAGTQYLVSGAASTFQPYTGSELTRSSAPVDVATGQSVPDPFTVPNVTYPAQGTYHVVARWYASCGVLLATQVAYFQAGSGEDCNDGADNDGDTLADCLDPECADGPDCVELPCDDLVDSDGDTLVDCEDPDCAADPACLPEDDCDDGVDNDGDTLVDCEDPDCVTDPACPETDCVNGADDDGDTLVDCADPDCAGTPRCIEDDCTNRADDDGDTLVDCEDQDCALDPTCLPETICDDGLDSDNDTFKDCDDSDCIGDPACGETECSNRLDDDGDTQVDCADADCFLSPDCVENCSNGVDDDGDTLVDCLDPDCAGSPACSESDCTNNGDDDGDTLIDCDDPDCAGSPACTETNCTNNVDDDGDTMIDCQDDDCDGDPACTETDCTNNADDDGDTLIDCLDPDCAGDPACTETDCTNNADDDGDTLIDCDDPDCAGAPNCDSDGDTVPDNQDCAPSNPTAWAIPGEIASLFVAAVAGAPIDDAEVSWTAPVPPGGTVATGDLVSGLISEMWASRGLLNATCLVRGEPSSAFVDTRTLPGRSQGFWYLVRARNACGTGPWGDSSQGPRPVAPSCD